MNKLIVYGMGKEYQKIRDEIWSNILLKYSIVALVDKKATDDKKEILGKEYPVMNDIRMCNEYLQCDIVVTSDKYYEEIVDELLGMQVNIDHIFSSSLFYDELCKNYFYIEQLKGYGVEIGGPSKVFSGIYKKCMACDGVNFSVNTVWSDNQNKEYIVNNKKIGKQIIADATDLSKIGDESYDFVLSSNNLEHIANPLKAILEFKRILKTGGILIILVPNKKYTFDHNRENTTFDHIQNDYCSKIREDDLSHIKEILENHDLSMDPGAGTMAQFEERSKNNYENRCLHQHVFSKKLLNEIAEFISMQIIENTEVNEDFYISLKK